MDLQLDRKEIFLISVVILMILAWTIGNLGGAYFGMQDEQIDREPDRAEGSGGSGGISFAIDIPDFLRNLVLVTVILGMGGWLLLSEESWKRKSMRGFVSLMVILVLYFLDQIIPRLIFIFSLFGSVLPNIKIPSISEIVLGEGSQALFPSGGSSIDILIFLGLILVVIFFIIRRKQILKRSSETEEDISSTADRAITELHEGDDVRDVIIRNYQKMLNILEEEGVKQEISFTPRELENMALAKLPLKGRTIDEMTWLFEEAKYSDHPLGEEKRNRAMENFKQIRDELEGEENA